MCQREKILVYPYDREFSPIVRHSEMMSNYTIVALVSPNGWGMSGKDASVADGGNRLDINISSDFESLLPLCNTVFFSESVLPLEFNKIILPKAIIAAEQGKNILYYRKISQEDERKLKEVCKKYNVSYTTSSNSENQYNYNESYNFKLQKINTPIIFVTGLYEGTQKFEIQLSLRENLSRLGYKVAHVGSREYSELLGFHSFPKFMYSTFITESDKIFAFNHYIKDIENKEKPDVIIVGIPGGIMRINDTFTGNFGIVAYEVSQAVTPDVAIVSSFYEDFNIEYFIRIAKAIRYKLGFDVSCYNLSNIQFDWSISKESMKESYLLLDSNFIEEKKSEYNMLNIPVFNILNNEESIKMASYIVDVLAYYGEIDPI